MSDWIMSANRETLIITSLQLKNYFCRDSCYQDSSIKGDQQGGCLLFLFVLVEVQWTFPMAIIVFLCQIISAKCTHKFKTKGENSALCFRKSFFGMINYGIINVIICFLRNTSAQFCSCEYPNCLWFSLDNDYHNLLHGWLNGETTCIHLHFNINC